MTPQPRHFWRYLLIVGAFVFSGGSTYCAAHWLVGNDAVYKRVFWSRFKAVAQSAELINHLGVWCWLGAGLLLGIFVVVVHDDRTLLQALGLILIGVAVSVALIWGLL